MENKINKRALPPLFIVLLIFIMSCTQSSTQLIKIKCITYDRIEHSSNVVLIHKENKGKRIYSYYDSVVSDTSMIMEIVQLKDENYIEFNKIRCNKIGENKYNVGGITWEISKYLFDKNDVQDEELVLFFNKLYGVIVKYNKPWLIYNTFESDSCSAVLIDNILKEELDLSGIKLPEPAGQMK